MKRIILLLLVIGGLSSCIQTTSDMTRFTTSGEVVSKYLELVKQGKLIEARRFVIRGKNGIDVNDFVDQDIRLMKHLKRFRIKGEIEETLTVEMIFNTNVLPKTLRGLDSLADDVVWHDFRKRGNEVIGLREYRVIKIKQTYYITTDVRAD